MYGKGIDDTSFDFRRPDEAPKAAAPKPAAEKVSSGSLSYALHPLVVINVSDHHTRVGRRVEVANSFEIKVVKNAAGEFEPVQAWLQTRLEQYLKNFPSYEMIGWYSTASDVQPGDLAIHSQLSEVNENLLYLLLDPVQALVPGNRDLPIKLHESELHVVDDTPTTVFTPVPYVIDSIESERIAVDHVAHILPSGDSSSGSALAQHLGTQYTAMSVLSERIDIVQKYLQAVQAGTVAGDHELLRQIKSLCSRLPAMDTARFNEEFLCEANNSLLVTHMAAITKGTGIVNDIIDKYNTAFDKHSRRRGIF